MKIKKIIVENIRSYESEEVFFPEGSTLLSGDIGSGKTSILLAIEFALFGLQPGQRGDSVLRNGKEKGKVKLEFEIDGREILVERTLKRSKKSVSQDYCAITLDDEKKELSVTELKDKILELLRYPKEFSRKQNILYKFTVYTPQEEMKQIIIQDPESRVNTLRHVFGIDKYKRIMENTSLLASRIREEKRIFESKIEDFETDKERLVSKEEELETKHSHLASIEKELFSKTENKKRIEEEIEEVRKKVEEKNKLQQEVEKTKIVFSGKKESIKENKTLRDKIQEQVKELKGAEVNESRLSDLKEGILRIKQKQKIIQEEKILISGKISSLKLKNQENLEVKEKISKIDICPTCLQDVNPVYRTNVANKIESEISGNLKKIKELEEELEKIEEKNSKLDDEIISNQKEIQETELLKVKLMEINEKEKRISELEKANTLLERDASFLEQQIRTLTDSISEFKKYERIFEEKKNILDNAMKEEREAEIKVAELKKEIEFFTKQIEEIKERLEKLKEIKRKLDYIVKIETWLSNSFIQLISGIERNVMIKLKSEFSELFAKWFSMLVSDSFEVTLNDKFSPVIEHQDYALDYDYLSGGERTAVALAYRLALNQVVNSLLSKIKTKDIVILDEPTDGFSEQQLDKMRDVFRQLDVKQLIIVSHEQKIESFVENVIRFRKDHGASKIIAKEFI